MDDDQNSKFNPSASPAFGGASLRARIQNSKLEPPPTPVSVPQKEQEPIPGSEFIRPSETEPKLHEEVKEVGVEKVREVPTLTLEDQKAGLTLAKESVPVATTPSGLVDLPKTEQEALAFLRIHRKIKDSIVWLVAQSLRQFRKVHAKVVGIAP